MVGKNLAEDPYEHLANAIILSAVSDYRAALKRVKRNPENLTFAFFISSVFPLCRKLLCGCFLFCGSHFLSLPKIDLII